MLSNIIMNLEKFLDVVYIIDLKKYNKWPEDKS